MEQDALHVDHDLILVEAAWRYGVDVDQAHPLVVDEDTHVYTYERDGKGFVLKWTTEAKKSAVAMRAESEWVNYLAGHGAPVCRIIP